VVLRSLIHLKGLLRATVPSCLPTDSYRSPGSHWYNPCSYLQKVISSLCSWDGQGFNICLLFSNHTPPSFNCTPSFPQKSSALLCSGFPALQRRFASPERAHAASEAASASVVEPKCSSPGLPRCSPACSPTESKYWLAISVLLSPDKCSAWVLGSVKYTVRCLDDCRGAVGHACIILCTFCENKMTESYSCLSDSHQRLNPVSTEPKVKLPLTLRHDP